MASVSDILQTMSGKTVTQGWDALVGYDAASVNELFAQQFVANVKQNQNLQPINATIDLAAGVQVQLVNVVLGPPLISFDPQLSNQQATITMNFVSGDVLVLEQSGPVQYVSGYQSIVPGDQYSLRLVVDLAQAQGEVTAQKAVVVDLSNAAQCTANLLPGTSAAAYLGTYFQSFLAKEAQGQLTYQLGAIVVSSGQDLIPSSFDIRTQANPSSTSDGAVLLFVATNFNTAGGASPVIPETYFLPSDYGCFVFVASKTLFGNVMPAGFQASLVGSPTFTAIQGNGSDASSSLQFTGGGVDCGPLQQNWSSNEILYEFWSGAFGSALSPAYADVTVPYSGIAIEPSNDLLTVSWSGSVSQHFAGFQEGEGRVHVPEPASGNATINISGSFTATPALSSTNDNLIVFSGSGSPSFSWQSFDWAQKAFGSGLLVEQLSQQLANYVKPVAQKLLTLQLPQVNTFAVTHMFFPAQNVVQLSEVHVPGDLACFGKIAPAETTFALTPLQSVIAAGQTVQFTPTNGATVAEWGMNPIRGTIASGLYTAPASVAETTQVVITATDANNDVATSIVTVVPSSVAVSPAFTMVFPNGAPVQFTAAVLGGDAVTWSVQGTGSVDGNGLYTPPSTLPSGVSVDIVMATAGTQNATALVALVNAVPAFSMTPPFANGTQSFTASGATFNWSVLPASAGTIDPSGNYTAPYEVAQNTTALVVAQDAADANLVALAVVLL